VTGHRLLFAMVTSELLQGARVSPNDVDANLTVTGRSGDVYA
jgi:hypothetical protein